MYYYNYILLILMNNVLTISKYIESRYLKILLILLIIAIS